MATSRRGLLHLDQGGCFLASSRIKVSPPQDPRGSIQAPKAINRPLTDPKVGALDLSNQWSLPQLEAGIRAKMHTGAGWPPAGGRGGGVTFYVGAMTKALGTVCVALLFVLSLRSTRSSESGDVGRVGLAIDKRV